MKQKYCVNEKSQYYAPNASQCVTIKINKEEEDYYKSIVSKDIVKEMGKKDFDFYRFSLWLLGKYKIHDN